MVKLAVDYLVHEMFVCCSNLYLALNADVFNYTGENEFYSVFICST